MKKEGKRVSEYPVSKIFLNRRSPRALSGEKISKKQLMSLFEAAKWAPSNANSQPWRFIYATKGSKHWKKFFDLLVEFNQMWCKNASVLALVISRKTFDDKEKFGKRSLTHSFDTGSAWMSLALQASMVGLAAHGMAGFDYKKARKVLKIPKHYTVEAMFAIGKKGKLSMIPERMQKGEKATQRKKLSEIVFEGKFKGK